MGRLRIPNTLQSRALSRCTAMLATRRVDAGTLAHSTAWPRKTTDVYAVQLECSPISHTAYSNLAERRKLLSQCMYAFLDVEWEKGQANFGEGTNHKCCVYIMRVYCEVNI